MLFQLYCNRIFFICKASLTELLKVISVQIWLFNIKILKLFEDILRFSSRGESIMFQKLGADVINMTTVPEVTVTLNSNQQRSKDTTLDD